MKDQYLLGVDFSSAPTHRKPITVAVGLMPTTNDPVYRLQTIREIETLRAFEHMLTEPLTGLAVLIYHLGNHASS